MKLRHMIAAAFAIGTAFAAPAQAGVLAASDLTIRSLFLIDTSTNAVATGITIKSDSRTGNATADFNGVQAVGPGPGNITSATPGATVDVKKRCIGTSCPTIIGENDTTTHLNTPAGNFALSDMFLAGSAVAASGANGLTRADVSITDASSIGGANSTILNGVTAVTKFEADRNATLKFGLTYDAFVKVFMDNALPGVASAKYSWSLALTDTTTHTDVLSYNPTELNKGFTISDPGTDGYQSAGALFSTAFTAISGHTYSLTINQASNSLASLGSEVPEPGSVMLVGLGLAALGASVRRRRAR